MPSHSPVTDYRNPEGDGAGTPDPSEIRIQSLEKQVQTLVRKYQAEQVSQLSYGRGKADRSAKWRQ